MVECLVGTDNGIYIGTIGGSTFGGLLLRHILYLFLVGQLFGGTLGNGGVVSDASLFRYLLVVVASTLAGDHIGMGGRHDEPIA